LLPKAKRSSGRQRRRVTDQRKWQTEESAMTGAPVWNLSHFAKSEVSDIAGSSQTGRIVIEQRQGDRRRATA